MGIPPENLARIFGQGFSTRKDGHGFGLHSSALAAQDLGGRLTAHSDGAGLGATFYLDIPLHPKPRPGGDGTMKNRPATSATLFP
jgi:sensor histidine kinase regulating citrate/malate metabolism